MRQPHSGFRQSLALYRIIRCLSTSCRAQPVSVDEFTSLFRKSCPPSWDRRRVAVAFSGGPDSTCLLHLLRRLRPRYDVVAVTVDHGLQSTSNAMTDQCRAIASRLDVQHIALHIPWGSSPFPSVPSVSAFENVAREARYHLLFEALQREGIDAIAFGHHLDDQVETAMLRASRGSTELGAAGMRPFRRWGMGFGSGPSSLGWAGHHGMHKWIIRPLLSIPKDRLVATCRHAGLEYVTDATNADPAIALRNRVRHQLATNTGLSPEGRVLIGLAANTEEAWSETLPTVMRLRSAVEALGAFSKRLDEAVGNELQKCVRTSPISTILLSSAAFASIAEESVRLEVVRRVLKYVSPLPWGSPAAEAGRRTASLRRISDALAMGAGEQRRPVVAGGGVLWSPVLITKEGRVKFDVKDGEMVSSHGPGWLASRQPPIRRFRNPGSESLEVDITAKILSCLDNSENESVEVLYDCRFVLSIRPRLISQDVLFVLSEGKGRLVLTAHSRYFFPRLVVRIAEDERLGRQESRLRLCDHEIVRPFPDDVACVQGIPQMGEDNKDRASPEVVPDIVEAKFIRLFY